MAHEYMDVNFVNLLMWDARMRNPKKLSPEEQKIVDGCEYLQCIRRYSIDTNFYEFNTKQSIPRSFGHSCGITCLCYSTYST